MAANLLAATAPEADVAGQTFNIATGHRFDLNQTVELLRPLTGYTGDVEYAPDRVGDISILWPTFHARRRSKVSAVGGLPGRSATHSRVVSRERAAKQRELTASR